jgi:hypothetical protein
MVCMTILDIHCGRAMIHGQVMTREPMMTADLDFRILLMALMICHPGLHALLLNPNFLEMI